MNEFLKNTASLTATEITTNKIYLEGEEIGDAMLPKLVKRASLTPIVEDGIVKENNYYTLHNDAGTCLYTSPFMRYEENVKTSQLFPAANPKRWYWMTVGAGTSKRKGGKRKKENVKLYKLNIDHEYDAFVNSRYKALHYVPKQSLRLWKAQTVESARYAFAETGLYYCATNFQKLKNAAGMFTNCEELEKFTSKNFRSCTDASHMFRGCIKLEYLGIDTQTAFINLENATEMFRGCVILPEASLKMDKVETAEGMFRDCVMLTSVAGSSFQSVTDITSMFDGCVSLQTIDSTCLGNSIKYGNHAFFRCQSLTHSPLNNFPLLETGAFMFAESGLESITADFPALTNAESMFDKCKSLTDTPIESFSAPNVVIARRMFRDTPITSPPTSFSAVKDGLSMFQGTNITSIPCRFPSLVNARQMFYYTNISGALDLDFTTHFPNVKHRESGDEDYYGGGSYATARMFGGCPITEISFDVSTLDDGISMFWECRRLTRCTKAVFKTGGNYQSMFTEASFDLESGQRILDAARSAGVAALHIGMNANLKSDEWIASNGLIQYEEDPNQYHTSDSKIFIKWNDPNLPIPEYIN